MPIYPRHVVRLTHAMFSKAFQVLIKRKDRDSQTVEQFENSFCKYIGSEYALGVDSARRGLYLALKAMDFPKNSEVIIPSYTFFALPLVVLACGLRPVFIDVDPNTYNSDSKEIQRHITSQTKAILITHMFGQPCDMDSIMNIVNTHNLTLIEDCAHSCGATYKGKKVGSFGDYGLYSFNMGKNMPCFGGGMLTIKDKKNYELIQKTISTLEYPSRIALAKKVVSTYMFYLLTQRYIFPLTLYPLLRLIDLLNSEVVDNNMEEKIDMIQVENSLKNQKRFTSLQSMVGMIQLDRLDELNEKTRKNALNLTQELQGVKGIKLQSEIADVVACNLYYTLKLDKTNDVRKQLRRVGIDTKRDDMSVCTKLDVFSSYKTECPNAESLYEKGMELPVNPYLSQKDIQYIASHLRDAIKK